MTHNVRYTDHHTREPEVIVEPFEKPLPNVYTQEGITFVECNQHEADLFESDDQGPKYNDEIQENLGRTPNQRERKPL